MYPAATDTFAKYIFTVLIFIPLVKKISMTLVGIIIVMAFHCLRNIINGVVLIYWFNLDIFLAKTELNKPPCQLQKLHMKQYRSVLMTGCELQYFG